MSTKINRLSRQKSIMTLVESNPLEAGTVGSEALNLKVENLTAAVLISDVDLSSLLVQLKATESNEERLQILESSKTPHLFSSESLSKLLDITTSVKTRIAIIQLIGPRLTDPRAKTEYFLALFRFAEEKSIVEEVLKARIQSLSSALFNKGDQMKSNIMAGRGGRGGAAPGRGGAGRGAGRGPAASVGSAVSSNSTAPVPVSIPAVVMSPSKPDSSQITTATTSPGNKHTVTTPVTKVGVLANYLVSDANESPAGSSSNLMESSTMEDVFDMLDKLPLNPNGPAPSSPAKTASKHHQDLQTISENSDDDDDSRANTPFGSTLTLDQHLGIPSQPLLSSSSGETKGIALNTSRLAANNVSNESMGSIGPETVTPRVPVPVTSGSTGSMPPVSSPAATNTRMEQTPSPVVKTEVVHQTDSLKMILETRSSNRTSIRLEAVESSQTHYHEVETSPARQISSVDTPVATNPSAFSPSSTVVVAAETPQTYDRAAMLRRLDGESDFKSPATSSPRSSGKHLNLTPMGRSEEVNRVLFDSKMSSESPNSSGKQKLVISSLNSTQKADLKSESGDSQSGDAVSKSESLDDYFALPRTRSFLVATPIEVATSSRSPAKEVEAAVQPTSVATTTAPVNSSSMDSTSVLPTSSDSADNNTKRVSPLVISTSASTKSLSSSKVPFAADNADTPTTTTTEEEPTPISFHALRSAFMRGDSTSSNLDSNRPPRRHSMVPLSSSSNNIMASVHSAPPSLSREPSSSSPMKSGVTPTRPISRRHSEISISTLAMAESAAKSAASNPALFSNDAAAKCAAALNMDKASFLALQVEEGWESSTADGTVARFYSYRELVRRNFCKEYVDLAKSELEKYLSNTEFNVVFAKSKEQFFAQPRWKQMDQKKKALLF